VRDDEDEDELLFLFFCASFIIKPIGLIEVGRIVSSVIFFLLLFWGSDLIE
jgi:hypothetical protein